MKKKKKLKVVKWEELKVGDFIGNNFYSFFCFRKDKNGPACLGITKGRIRENFHGAYVGGGILEYRKMKPTKVFIELCKSMLHMNFKEAHIDNLSYIEALSALKKYD